jgi:hypothetical protein
MNNINPPDTDFLTDLVYSTEDDDIFEECITEARLQYLIQKEELS